MAEGLVTTHSPGQDCGESRSQCSDEEFCSICFGEFTEEEPAASRGDAKGHGIVFECGHAAKLHLSCLTLEAQQNRPFQCPLCRTKFGFSKTCICGCELQERLTNKPIPEYDGAGVCCDHCSRIVGHKESIFHCPKGKIGAHPAGYDICGQCANMSGGARTSSTVPTCSCGHRLIYSPMRTNICDINGIGCKKEGTKYRCGSGCDFDACDVCYSVSLRAQVRHIRRRTHPLRARRNASATRASTQQSTAATDSSRPRAQSVTSIRRSTPPTGSGSSRLLAAGAALVRSTSSWRP